MNSSARRAQTQVGFQQEGGIASLANCFQWSLHDFLIPDRSAMGVKNKIYQIFALGKGPTRTAAATASTS